MHGSIASVSFFFVELVCFGFCGRVGGVAADCGETVGGQQAGCRTRVGLWEWEGVIGVVGQGSGSDVLSFSFWGKSAINRRLCRVQSGVNKHQGHIRHP